MLTPLIYTKTGYSWLASVRCQLPFNDEYRVNEACHNMRKKDSRQVQLKNHQQMENVLAAGGCKSCKEPLAKLSRWMADIRIRIRNPLPHPLWKTAIAKKANGIASNKRKPQNGPQLTHSPETADPKSVDLQAKSYPHTHTLTQRQHKTGQNQKLNKTKRKTMTTILHSYANVAGCPLSVFHFWGCQNER